MRTARIAACCFGCLSGAAALGGGTDAPAPARARAAPFDITEGDPRYKLNVGGQVQFRYIANFRDTDGTPGDKDFAHGFETRRSKIRFSGNVLSEDLSFRILGAFDRGGGAFRLEEAWVRYNLGEGWFVRAGQYKLPVLREYIVSSSALLAVDRSIANEVFKQEFGQGVEAGFQKDLWRASVVVSDGFASRNTAYTSASEADIALTGRVERRGGDAPWRSYDDMASFRGARTGWMAGGAFHWQRAGDTAAFDADGMPAPRTLTDTIVYTADLSLEGDGWNLYGAFIGRWTDADGAASFDDFGAVVQGGYFVSERCEVFGRWDAVFPDGGRPSGSDNFHTLTAGVNHYFIPSSHAAKLTVDVQVFLDDQAGSASIVSPHPGVGMLASTESGQVALRVQMQLLF